MFNNNLEDDIAPRWSLSTVCLGGSLQEKFAAMADAGFSRVDLFFEDFTASSRSARDVRRMAEDLGLDIVALLPLRDFEAMGSSRRVSCQQRADHFLDVALELGTDSIVVCANTDPDASDDSDEIASDLGWLADRARIQGIRVGYEPLPWATCVRSLDHAISVIRRVRRDNLRAVLDNFHIQMIEGDISAISALGADEIEFVQISDAPRMALDAKTLSRNFRCFPGQGDLPVLDFYRAVLSTGYRGHVSLEVFNALNKSRSALELATMAMRSIAGMRGSEVKSGEGCIDV